jgi:hypothetical protein
MIRLLHVRYSTVQYSKTLHNVVQCSTVQFNAVHLITFLSSHLIEVRVTHAQPLMRNLEDFVQRMTDESCLSLCGVGGVLVCLGSVCGLWCGCGRGMGVCRH